VAEWEAQLQAQRRQWFYSSNHSMSRRFSASRRHRAHGRIVTRMGEDRVRASFARGE
jgi:hypothetical protein